MSARILNLDGAHPKVRIDSVDAAAGVVSFAWLDSDGNQVDSGGSIARFEPVAVPDSDPVEYEEPTDETLADAIANPPPDVVPVPQVISRAEFIIAARRVLGITEGTVFALISQLPAGDEQETARDLWEHAREFHRDNSFLNALAQANGNTSEELDEVFRTGAALDLS